MTDIENGHKELERLRSKYATCYISLSQIQEYPYREAVKLMKKIKNLDEVDFIDTNNQVCTITRIRSNKHWYSYNIYSPNSNRFIIGAETILTRRKMFR